MKSTAKSTSVNAASKANAKDKAKVTVKVPAHIIAEINIGVKLDHAKSVATVRAENQQVKLADLITKSPMAKQPRNDVRDALAPIFTKAYSKVGKSDEYADSQLSRVMSLVFLGKSIAKDNTAATKARESMAAYRASGQKVIGDTLIAMSTGRMRFDSKRNKVVEVKRSSGRTPHNRKSPVEQMKFDIGNIVTAGVKSKKIAGIAYIIAVCEALKACKQPLPSKAEMLNAIAD